MRNVLNGIGNLRVTPTTKDIQTIIDKRQRKAEYNRQYRARKKAALAASGANNINKTCDFVQQSTSTNIEHSEGRTPTENRQTVTDKRHRNAEFYRQYRARK